MERDILEIREYTGDGYKPVVYFGAWRVAFLNTADRFRRENLHELERHVDTDETFTILKGRGILYVSDGDDTHPGTISGVRLEPCKVYNVPQGVWHAIEVEEDTSVLITENSDTSSANTRKIPITPDMLPAVL